MISVSLKKCNECNVDFESKAWNVKFCNNLCKAKFNSRLYYSRHKEICLNKKKDYYEENRKEIIKRNADYCDTRRKVDVDFRIKRYMRARLYSALKNNYKSGSAVSDLGCSINELRVYLESQFTDGMSWSNYGKWHIDHIIPLDSFTLSNRDQLKLACHYSNLQPLWGSDNIRKSNK